jgi:hypothetical protein
MSPRSTHTENAQITANGNKMKRDDYRIAERKELS